MWNKTEYPGIDERGGICRVRNGRTYVGTFETTVDAKRVLEENSSGQVYADKKRRISKDEYIELLTVYNTYFVDKGWEPGDVTALLQFRRNSAEVVFTCPVAYGLGISGNDAGFWDCIALVYKRNPDLAINMALTRSGVAQEKQRGLESCYSFHRKVIEQYIAKGFNVSHHSWVTTQTNHFVAHYMGWLMTAHQIGLVAHVQKGKYDFCCGVENQKWCFQSSSQCSFQKYESFFSVISAVLAVSPVKTLDDFVSLAKSQDYHYRWLVRAVAYGEREAAGCTPLVARKGLSCDKYDEFLPDDNGYMDWLGDFGKLDVRAVGKKFFNKGRDALLYSMDTCVAGWLRNLDRDALRYLTDEDIRKARNECLHPTLKL